MSWCLLYKVVTIYKRASGASHARELRNTLFQRLSNQFVAIGYCATGLLLFRIYEGSTHKTSACTLYPSFLVHPLLSQICLLSDSVPLLLVSIRDIEQKCTLWLFD